MARRALVCGPSVVCLLILLPSWAAAQSSLAPSEVVGHIQRSGTTVAVIQDLLFEGCPQDDEEGRAMFEAVSNADLPSSAVAELSGRWAAPFAECGYAPLELWYQEALRSLFDSGDPSAVMTFVQSLPASLPDPLREELWRGRAMEYPGGFLGDFIASKAVRGSTPSQSVDLTVSAFRDRRLSRQWIYREAGRLMREQPDAYLRSVAQAAGGFNDERLEDVLRSILASVQSGRIPEDAGGLEALRQSVRNRDGLPAEVKALRRD